MSAKDKARGFGGWEAGWKSDPGARACERPGCAAAGEHKAPKSRDRLDEYYWFCRDHARDYNASWNFFDGMEADDIHRFQHDNAFWHRPTWRFGNGGQQARREEDLHVQDPFDFFAGQTWARARPVRERRDGSLKPLDAKELKALAVLGLGAQATAAEIKTAFKRLAKALHPDKTGGDRALEARFQEVLAAYQCCVDGGIC